MMKKILMTKYGFVRCPEEDFGDDGNRFVCYRVGERVRVSKCTYKGEAFIDATIHGTKLPYDVYSKLPHYPFLGKLNGVSIEALIGDDLTELYENCLAYEQEYTEAENSIKMPTLDEIKEQCIKVQAKRIAELAEIETLFSKYAVQLALKLEAWQWKQTQDYLTKLAAEVAKWSPEQYASTILNSARSVYFCKPDCSELSNSYYYKYLMDLIKSVQD
jgi:hypothetical protein